jgi:hypothetical protein
MLLNAVPESMLAQETQLLLGWYKHYWDAYKQHEFIDLDALDAVIKLRSNYPPETMALVMRLTAMLRKPIDESVISGIVGQLVELDFAGRAAAVIASHQAGGDVHLVYELGKLVQESKERGGKSDAHDYIREDVVSILDDEAGDVGVKLPTLLLQQNVKGLMGGVSVAVAARPDKGKTSLLAAILTHAAPQLPKYFEADRPILWLNNEGRGRRIIPRVYQAALDCSVDELYTMSNSGVLVPNYTKAIGGQQDKIRIKDMHGATLPELEQVIEAVKPAMVCFDMVANFRLPGAGGSGNKADEVEEKWIQIREMAVRHDFISFGTVQISDLGGDQLYPPYNALKDSRTGIQGATDIILMMGALDDARAQSLRGLSTPKNKFAMSGKQSHCMGEVVFDGANCQFRDGQVEYQS